TKNPARAMAIGVIAGGFTQMIFQLPFVIKTGWKISFCSIKKAFTNSGTRKVMLLVLPTIIGMAAYQINDVVSSTLAKRAGIGIYASLQYSLRLQELILGIFAVSIGSVILPDMAGLAQKKQWEDFTNLLIQSIKIIILISIPVTFYSLICGKEIISLVYKSKNFTDESVKMTLSVFHFHMIGLAFIALNRILAPAFYAQKNTTLPTFAGLFNFAVNITLASILVNSMSGAGIALSLSIASFANSVFLFASMPHLNSVKTKKIVVSFILYSLKITTFAFIASIPTYFSLSYFAKIFEGHGRFIFNGGVIACTALIFALVGFFLLIITGDKTIKIVIEKLLRKKPSTDA
ncbi:MAG: murein biosynthesis integral membrane protein MurJ, partial [Treponema sp.]|nr:murein biosynthesis integral membrane protein MurJ [Treponema sp.]